MIVLLCAKIISGLVNISIRKNKWSRPQDQGHVRKGEIDVSADYIGAVKRLLNYQQVSDDNMENRLKTLNLDLNKPQQQQQWWLLRLA
jgi:hypothetical protein